MSKRAGCSARTRLEKLGIAAGTGIAVLGIDDPGFARELAAAGVAPRGRASRATAIILLGATTRRHLARLRMLERTMPRAGAVWVVWPKGRPALTEDHVRNAALETGLVDVKVIAFSAALSALKLVIPVRRR
jgi:hypothetical protein